MDENLDEIKWTLKKYSQEHLLNGFENLSEKNQKELIQQIKGIDFDLMKNLYENTKKETKVEDFNIKPIDYVDKDKLYDNFAIKVASGHKFFTEISYNPITSILSIDRSNSGSCRDIVHERKCKVADKNGEIKLRVLLDRFSVEIFVNDGEQALSTTIYTPQTDSDIIFDIKGMANVEVEKHDLNM